LSSNRDDTGRTRPTASVLGLGCKVNQFESAALGGQLTRAGYTLVAPGNPADVTVINTCTVTHRADFEVRALVRRAYRKNPQGRIVVTGCLAQLRPQEMADLPGVALVLGQEAKADLVRYLDETEAGDREKILVPPPGRRRILDLGFPAFDRTRAFFRIQDGCSAACAYCTVPLARGPSRSLPPERVTEGLAAYAAAGYAEVVLCGIHLGAWGLDLDPPMKLSRLLDLVLEEPGPRLRLSSIEPNEIGPEIIGRLESSTRLCPHLHLPLQSGSDRILARMGRPYTADFYAGLATRLKKARPEICLGADVLIGFPGEDEAVFAKTFEFLQQLPLSYLHVFSFSRRPFTRAASMDGQVSPGDIKDRVGRLREMSRAKRQAFFQSSLGQVRPTLVENARDKATGLARGLTDNYIQVLITDPPPPSGQIAPIRLVEMAGPDRVLGRAL